MYFFQKNFKKHTIRLEFPHSTERQAYEKLERDRKGSLKSQSIDKITRNFCLYLTNYKFIKQ